MNFRRFRQALFPVMLAMSLFTATVAAPLCACLEAKTDKPKHDCCPPEVKDHCPMGGAKVEADNLISFSRAHEQCVCPLEKRESSPVKKELKISQPAILARDVIAKTREAVITGGDGKPVFRRDEFTPKDIPGRTSARAPPRLVK